MDESQARRLAHYYPGVVELAEGLLDLIKDVAGSLVLPGRADAIIAELDDRLATFKSKIEEKPE